MKTSTYYNLKLVEGTDTVNPLTTDVPNYETIDEQMHNNSIAGVTLATEVASGKVHALVRENNECAIIRFIATSNWALGDTITVDGIPVVALLPSGEALHSGAYVINANVLCVLTGTNLTVYVGGNKVENANQIPYNETNVGDELDKLNGNVGQINGSIEQINGSIEQINGSIGQINNNFVYSTSEKIVGKWIDNKPIYSKTFSIVNPSNNQIIDSDKTKKLIKIEAFGVGNNGYTFVIPYAGMDTDIYATPNGLLFRTNDTWTGFTLYVTYYYTKN